MKPRKARWTPAEEERYVNLVRHEARRLGLLEAAELIDNDVKHRKAYLRSPRAKRELGLRGLELARHAIEVARGYAALIKALARRRA